MSEFNPFDRSEPEQEEAVPAVPVDDEQALRDRLGFSASERRSAAERAATAARIREKTAAASSELPEDVARVWGRSDADRQMAAHLIARWGLEHFRGSAVHRVASAQAVAGESFHADAKPESKAKK